MNIAVHQGAKEGDSFVNYIKFLEEKGYVAPNTKTWVDEIRKKGNEATHKAPPSNKGDAEQILAFVELLLKIIYEAPSRLSISN